MCLDRQVNRFGILADFQNKSSIKDMHLNLPLNCYTKHSTRYYARPLLATALLCFSLGLCGFANVLTPARWLFLIVFVTNYFLQIIRVKRYCPFPFSKSAMFVNCSAPFVKVASFCSILFVVLSLCL